MHKITLSTSLPGDPVDFDTWEEGEAAIAALPPGTAYLLVDPNQIPLRELHGRTSALEGGS